MVCNEEVLAGLKRREAIAAGNEAAGPIFVSGAAGRTGRAVIAALVARGMAVPPRVSDDKARQTPERLIARKDLVEALEQGRTRLGLRLRMSHAMRDSLVADASGDLLDAVACMVFAAWALDQPGHGIPPDCDPLEGWIVGA